MNAIKALLTLAALAMSPTLFAGAVPSSWTQDQIAKHFGGAFVVTENGQLSIQFKKTKPGGFHGGECFALVIDLLRGPEGRAVQADDASITVCDEGWSDRVTGFLVKDVDNP